MAFFISFPHDLQPGKAQRLVGTVVDQRSHYHDATARSSGQRLEISAWQNLLTPATSGNFRGCRPDAPSVEGEIEAFENADRRVDFLENLKRSTVSASHYIAGKEKVVTGEYHLVNPRIRTLQQCSMQRPRNLPNPGGDIAAVLPGADQHRRQQQRLRRQHQRLQQRQTFNGLPSGLAISSMAWAQLNDPHQFE